MWQFGYDTASPPKLIRVTDPTGAHTDYTWTSFVRADGTTLPLVRAVTDRLGHTRTANGYDSQGRVVTQTYADGGVLMAAYSSASPGENGTTTITDPRGNVTKWDFTWNPMMFGYTGVQVTDPLGRVTQFSRAGSSLLVTSVTDFRNRTTSFEWDHTRGNLLSLTTPSVQANGTSTTVTWAFRYEPTFNQLTEVIDPLGRQVSLTVDSATGNTTSIRDPKGYTTAQNFAKNGDLISLSNALGQVTRFRYTDEGDLQAITDASGNVTLFLLDGASRLVGIRDANGVWDQIQYTPLDLVDSTTRLLSGVPVVTRFQYDAEENLRFLTDSLEQSWEWRYDEKNRPIQEIDPRGASTFSAWDQNDDLVKWRDRKGQVGEFTFGTADRFTGAVFRRKDENAAESSYTVSYDPSTDLVSSIVDSVAGTFTPHFDAVDRLSSEDWLEAGGATTRTLTHTLDELDRRVTLQATGQNPISYLYDQRDDIVSITQDSATTSLEYDGLGRLVKRSLPNGVSTEWGFNAVGDLTSLISRRNGVPFDSHSYTLWPAGNISQEVVNGVTWNFQQDDLYRLTQASAVGGSTYAWEYDLAGNRLSQTVDGKKTVYGYGPGNRLISVNGVPLQYDENGNLTAYGTDLYSWDVRDQLVGLSRPGLTAAFSYDYSGQRSSKTINGLKTSFLYDGDDLVSEITGASVVNTLHGPFIDEPLKRDGLYFTPNHLGSTTTLTNSSGNVVDQYFYLPFGETWEGGGTTNPFQFTGRENDGTGLMYYRARYYSAEWGRFISEDPIGFAGGINPYVYCDNDPDNWLDPFGLKQWWEFQIPLSMQVAEGARTALMLADIYGIARSAEVVRRREFFTQRPASLSREEAAIGMLGRLSKAGSGASSLAKSTAKAGLTQLGKRRLAKFLGGIARSSQPTRQGRYGRGKELTKWWEYITGKGEPRIVVEHADGSVHVGEPKPQSTHLSGGTPKYYPLPGVPTHIGDN